MSTTASTKLGGREQSVKEIFIGECWTYLRNNFHKFNQTNQIKIALELCKKDVPQVMTGEIKYTSMQMIRIEQRPLSLDLGEDIPDAIKTRINDRAAQDSADA